jgi:hypothetical protein
MAQVFTALLDTSVLWPSLQRDFLLSLAIEGMYRPVWSTAILEELEYHETAKLIKRGEAADEAAQRAVRLATQMRAAFEDAEVQGWEGLEGDVKHDSDRHARSGDPDQPVRSGRRVLIGWPAAGVR